MNITIRCRKPPVVNVKQDIALYFEGATEEIDEDTFNASGFWQGQVERGAVEIVKAEGVIVEKTSGLGITVEPNLTKPVEPDVEKAVKKTTAQKSTARKTTAKKAVSK